jgi:hypothetical protein
MNLWDKVVWPGTVVPRLDDRFTAEEAQRLTALRQQVVSQPVHLDLGIDVRRLEFARWLVEQGHLSEAIAPSAPDEGATWEAA